MSQQIFFAHANGFPSATYGKLFAALAPQYQVAHLELHGHDPRFPVDDNWHNLVDELIHHLEQQPAPVWGVGHSLGGVLHLHAALRCPELYRGVVMLDSPVLTRADQWVILAGLVALLSLPLAARWRRSCVLPIRVTWRTRSRGGMNRITTPYPSRMVGRIPAPACAAYTRWSGRAT